MGKKKKISISDLVVAGLIGALMQETVNRLVELLLSLL
jgi:hypothetical protein